MIRQVIIAAGAGAIGVMATFSAPPVAQAQQFCPEWDEPVCGRAPGQKQVTYRNECIANQNNAQVLYEGQCKKQPRQPKKVGCTREYRPVCGRVGSRKPITYANACVARSNGANVLHQGRCKIQNVCSRDYRPVCGQVADQPPVTYANACTAKINGAKLLYRGRCL